MSRISVIIVAAGKGLRMGAELPKQFLSLSSRPILMRTIERFASTLPNADIILALHRDYITYWKELCAKYSFETPCAIISGGDTRFHSVQNCVNSLPADTEFIMIHDGVRPFISADLILRLEDAIKENCAVIPVIDVIDSLRKELVSGDNKVVDRHGLKAVQTPQCFSSEVLKKAYQQDYNPLFTDDASVVEAAGYKIKLVIGECSNRKITTREDMEFGEFLLKRD